MDPSTFFLLATMFFAMYWFGHYRGIKAAKKLPDTEHTCFQSGWDDIVITSQMDLWHLNKLTWWAVKGGIKLHIHYCPSCGKKLPRQT